MRGVRWSRNVCLALTVTSILFGPPFADHLDGALVPVVAATILSSAIGFMLFDREYIRLRRDE